MILPTGRTARSVKHLVECFGNDDFPDKAFCGAALDDVKWVSLCEAIEAGGRFCPKCVEYLKWQIVMPRKQADAKR